MAYSGSLIGTYGEMVANLARVLSEDPHIDFEYCGPTNGRPYWASDPGYRGVMPSAQYCLFLKSNNILLVTMSFKASDQRRSRTSFPSKLVEYCHTGLPILIWGPESCSAVRWAQQEDAAEVVSDADPQKLAKVLHRLRNNPERLTQIALRAQEAAKKEFNPKCIQQKFEAALRAAAISKRPDE